MDEQELAAFEKRVVGLKNMNRQMTNVIKQAGVDVDTTEARIETFMNFLMVKGLITHEELLSEQEAWELKLREQLQPVYEKVKQAIRLSGADVQTASGLIIPGANGKPKL